MQCCIFKLLVVFVSIILIIKGYKRHRPEFNLVKHCNKYHLYLWYNKYNELDNIYRTYIKLF